MIYSCNTFRVIFYYLATLCCCICDTAAAVNKSGVEPQVISLPKGPGSIEGLGESFEPQLNTGTATYRVKIAVSPGVNKHQPEVSLEYNSGYGNSAVGIGWDLAIPTIQRRTDKGIPGYTNNDTFTYSRSGDLVPTESGDYRQKIEGSFLRFRMSGEGWQVWERNGTQLFFGITAQARQNTRLGVFRWYLEKSVDTNGNEIHYFYTVDAGQVYLDEIRYAIMSNSIYKSVKFLYEGRTDFFSDYRSRSGIHTTKLLKSIEILSEANLVRKYQFDYSTGAGASMLTRVTQSGRDGNTSLPPMQFDYSAFSATDYSVRVMDNLPPAGISMENPDVDLVDIDGDALPDVIYTDPDVGHKYYINAGRGSFNSDPVQPDSSPFYLLSTIGVMMADMDGNGKADLLVKDDYRFGYFRDNNVMVWDAKDWTPCTPNPSFSFEDATVRLVDVNNDGLIDVMVDTGYSYRFWINKKNNEWSASFDLETVLPDGNHIDFTDQRFRMGDMNGDRMEDLVFVKDGYLSYYPSPALYPQIL